MAFRNFGAIGVAIAVLGTSAFAQNEENKEPKKAKFNIGVKGGVYLPSQSVMKDVFGSSIFVFGLSFDDFSRQADKWRLTLDFDFISGREDGDKFFAAPVMASVGRVFGSPGDDFRPFVRVGAGVAYFDYSITNPDSNERFSTKRLGFGGDVEVGFFLNDKFRLSAKYLLFSKADDFDFSGLQITATYNVFKF